MIINKSFPRKSLFTRHFISPLTSLKTPVKEIDKKYSQSLKVTLLASILVFLAVFQLLPKKFQLAADQVMNENIELIAEDITPRTEQLTRVQPPARPAVPIPIDDDEIPDDLTIAETELDFDEIPPAMPKFEESRDEGYRFIPYDSPPELIGGIASLYKYIQYPEIAQRAGVEGRVVVGVLVDEKGNGVKTTILQDSDADVGFEAAAQDAVMKVKWIPAKQRDNPVEVWTSLIVRFEIAGT